MLKERGGEHMDDTGGPPAAREDPTELAIRALWERVGAAMLEIERAKQERSTDEIRAARTQLAALHGVARLRRQTERDSKAA